MQARHALFSLLACGGCLAGKISQQIDQIDCGGTGTGTGDGTTDCPDTGDTAGSGVYTTTVGNTSGTDSDSGDAGGGSGSTGGSSTGTGGESSSSTGEPAAVCGNGVVEEFGAEPEDCDDGNDDPGDGCSDCGRQRLAFVTSADYQGAVFMGLEGADQRCRSLADQQDLPNFAGFKAWLSDSQVSAKQRMFRGRGRYVLVNGLVVVESWDALLAGELQNPINVTEASETKNYPTWTGTNPDGSAALGADHCADWTGQMDENRAFFGRSGEMSSQWSIAEAMGQPEFCSFELGLYCFEQE